MATNGITVGQFGFWTTSASIVLSAETERAGAITSLRLTPNPVVTTSRLSLSLTKATDVAIDLFDARGSRVASRSLGRLGAGEHDVALDFSGLASGSYSLSASVDGAMTRIPHTIVR
jgi:hypothetical protein